MDFTAQQVVINGQRTYNTLASGKWFEETQVISLPDEKLDTWL